MRDAIVSLRPTVQKTRHSYQVRPRQPTMVLAAVLLLIPLLLAPPLQIRALARQSDWRPPTAVYLPETGHTLDRLFLDQWRSGGGATTYGYPITPEITQSNGHIVQYLQYARFEYWPEGDTDGNVVIVAAIGYELRPVTVARSVPSFGVVESGSRHAVDALTHVMQAWLPIQSDDLTDASAIYIEETKHSVKLGFRAFWENTGGASYLGHPLTEEYTLDGVTYQVFERGQLAWAPGSDPWMVPLGQLLADRYGLDQTPVAQGEIPTYSEDLFVPPPEPVVVVDAGPGPIPGTAKSIVVSISLQRMWAYEGNILVFSSLVSTGKPGFDTPTGMFSISKKVEIQDMEGLIGGEYYNVADVPDVMYFTTVGHAFHGTYWHNNFGAVMSHGCVNLPLDIAAALYDWTPMGTPVQIVA